MLKPAAMQRVAVVGLRQERQRVISLLHDLGVVQIEPLSKSVASVLKAETDTEASKVVSEELLRIKSLMSALPPVLVNEKRGFSSLQELIDVSKSVKIDGDVSSLKQRQERLTSQLDNLRTRSELVKNLEFIQADLSILNLESAASFFGTLTPEAYEKLRTGALSLQGVLINSAGLDPVKTVVVVPNSELEKFGAVIQSADARLERIPPMHGTAAEVLAGLDEETTRDKSELATVNEGLQKISEVNYATLVSLDEQLSIEARQLEVLNNFGFTESSFVLEGWVPKMNFPALRDALSARSSSTLLFEIESDEKPPTLMVTPKRLKFFESFTRVLTPPMFDEFDPTLIFAFVFPIFFGLMLGDVGYGLVILAIALWIKQRVENPGKKTLVPGALRRFGRSIFQPAQFRKLAQAMIPGAILGIIFGFLFNAYFGFHFNQYLFSYLSKSLHIGVPSYLVTDGAFLDPLSTYGLKTMLRLSGYIGLAFVSLGLVMGMINKYWEKENRHILGKAGWLCVAWGISLFGLLVLHLKSLTEAVNFSANPFGGVYIGLVVAGVGLIAYGEGGQALIELPSIVSHILSFTRLTGILLASIGFALVVNSQFEGLASSLYGGSVTASAIGFAIAGVVLLVVGQLFNIVLALFEPGIQGARLLFVEYFSKFYHGQGKLFSPFKGKRTYTLSTLETKAAGEPTNTN